MKVLITAASRHGSTAGIAQAIGAVLSSAGIETDVRPPDEVASVAPYDAVVLGSGVYAGRWLASAKKLVERDTAALAARPVWLFSSGPLGDPLKPDGEPPDVAPIREQTGAINHRLFAGKLDRRHLGLAEKAIVAVVHAPDGDFRPWDDVADWSTTIARTLQAKLPNGGAPDADRGVAVKA
jgi:menaquinone-dependent protoporphyrinogen oxidase